MFNHFISSFIAWIFYITTGDI